MDAFIGEIRAFGFGYCPRGWLACNGDKTAIAPFSALFSVIGDYFGPTDHKSYFTVPNLPGRTLLGGTVISGTVSTGAYGGTEEVALTIKEMPSHSHTMTADKRSGAEASLGTNMPGPGVFLSNPLAQTSSGGKPGVYAYSDILPQTETPNLILAGINGQGMPHDNMMPYLAMQYCICYEGEYPTPE